MSQTPVEPQVLAPATEVQVRSQAARLVALGRRHGLSELAFASKGRLRAHVDDARDFTDVFRFQREATALLGAEVRIFSDGALRNANVSPDLIAATLL